MRPTVAARSHTAWTGNGRNMRSLARPTFFPRARSRSTTKRAVEAAVPIAIRTASASSTLYRGSGPPWCRPVTRRYSSSTCGNTRAVRRIASATLYRNSMYSSGPTKDPRRAIAPGRGVHDAHDEGRPRAGCPMEELVHEQEALARCRRVRAGSEGGGADAGLKGAVLALDLDVLRGQLTE